MNDGQRQIHDSKFQTGGPIESRGVSGASQKREEVNSLGKLTEEEYQTRKLEILRDLSETLALDTLPNLKSIELKDPDDETIWKLEPGFDENDQVVNLLMSRGPVNSREDIVILEDLRGFYYQNFESNSNAGISRYTLSERESLNRAEKRLASLLAPIKAAQAELDSPRPEPTDSELSYS